MNDLLALLNGKKTYLAGLGFFGLALAQAFVTRDYLGALASASAGMQAIGLRHAIDKQAPAPPSPLDLLLGTPQVAPAPPIAPAPPTVPTAAPPLAR